MSHYALDIAKKIIHCTDVEKGDIISNLKLQKMLYYMQAYWLAIFKKPLFEEEIEAWMYGPVVPSVYDHFKKFGSSAIMPENVDEPVFLNFDNDEKDLFNNVIEEYGQFSAVKLMEMTHNETPWKSVSTGKGNIISKDLLKEYFLTQVEYV